MPPTPRRPVAWGSVVIGMAASAMLTGVVFWRINLQALDAELKEKRAALKKLALSGGILPNQEVMDYLTERQRAVEQEYQHWLSAVAVPPVAEAAKADPQLYFQEQVHEVQRTLERLAVARSLPVPEQLGLPKELPPSETVPRLLEQLSMMEELAPLILDQGVQKLASLKVEDPETIPDEEGTGTFLVRLPVRVRFTASLPQLMKILGAVERTTPLIDLQSLRVSPSGSPAEDAAAGASDAEAASAASPDVLDVELVLARHLVMAASQEPAPVGEPEMPSKRPAKSKL